jgi:penicillin-binding protein 1C
LVAIYAAIARGGAPVGLHESRDEPLERVSHRPVLDTRACWYLTSILSGEDSGGRGGGDLAVKTGTSYGYRDAWALGFDGRHVIGVWMGRPDAAPVSGLNGRASAVPLLRDAFARLGVRSPLPAPPRDVLLAASAELPPPLRRLRQGSAGQPDSDAVQIAYPPDGAHVDLGLTAGAPVGDLSLEVRDGRPPFVWLANGRPIAREPYARTARWRPDGPGFATLAVVDARGGSSRVTVYLE